MQLNYFSNIGNNFSRLDRELKKLKIIVSDNSKSRTHRKIYGKVLILSNYKVLLIRLFFKGISNCSS